MYWQVYLHKTGLAADKMLVKIIDRARYLLRNEYKDNSLNTPINKYLTNEYDKEEIGLNPSILNDFSTLDDHDIWTALKQWQNSDDKILSYLSHSFINRRLFKIKMTNQNPVKYTKEIVDKLSHTTGLNKKDLKYYVDKGKISNAAYIKTSQKIKLLKKTGDVIDIANATDLPNIKAMSRIVSKHYITWANDLLL